MKKRYSPLLCINPDNPQQRLIRRVCEVLEKGGLIAYPTDTFYGIGCDLYNKKGIQLIYRLKNSGYQAGRCHFAFNAIKSNAPYSEIKKLYKREKKDDAK